MYGVAEPRGLRTVSFAGHSQHVHVCPKLTFLLCKLDGIRWDFHYHIHSRHIWRNKEKWRLERTTRDGLADMVFELLLDWFAGQEIDWLHVTVPAARTD